MKREIPGSASFGRTAFVVLGIFLGLSSAHAEGPDFYEDVYPFLKTNCISCHNKTTTKAGLNMETPELMIKGGDSGPSIIPGDSKKSLIVEASLHVADLEMPPKNNKTDAVNLTPAQIATLKSWIDLGAKASTRQARQVVWKSLAAGVHPIYSLAMTRDGRLAACGRSNQIDLYDLATRQFVSKIVDPAEKKEAAHRALVHSLAFSPDGTRLASGSFREVKIWKKESGKAIKRPGDKGLGIQISTLSPNGQKIVGVSESGSLFVINASDGKVEKKIDGVKAGPVKLLGVSPDHSKAVLFAEGGNLQIWNLADGTLLASHSAPDLAVEALVWTGQGKAVATGGTDKLIRVWSLPPAGATEFPPPRELKGATNTITNLVAGSNPDQLISWSKDNKLRIWSVSGAKVITEIATPAGILAVSQSNDGKQIATGGTDRVIRIWDVAGKKQGSELRGCLSASRQVAELELVIARQTLEQAFQRTATAKIEAQNKALDELLKKAKDAIVAEKKKLPVKEKAVKPAQDAVATAQKTVDEAAEVIAKAPEGKPDASMKGNLKTAQDKLITAKIAETSALAAFKAVQANITDAETQVTQITATKTENGKKLAASKAISEKAKKQQGEATADLAAAKKDLSKATPLAVTFSSDSHELAATFDDGTLLVWGLVTGMPIEEISGIAAASSLVSRTDGGFATCSADASLATSGGPMKWVLERKLGDEKDPTLFADRVNAVVFSPDGKTLAVGGGEPSRTGDISLFAVSSGKLVTTWKDRHDDSVVSLDFSPDGKRLASGAADKIAKVTEIATGKQVGLFEGHTHYVMDVAFRADGRVLATAGADGAVISWDLILGERKKKITGWTKEVTSLQFIGATNQIVTSAGDNLIRIVNDDGGQIRSIANLPDFMQATASTPNGETIIGGGEDSFLRVWNGKNGKEVASFGMQ